MNREPEAENEGAIDPVFHLFMVMEIAYKRSRAGGWNG
jgi:hypothetical protein